MQPAQTRTAIITGGAQGIGRGIALHLLEQGLNVAAVDVDQAACDDLLLACSDRVDRLLCVRADVACEAEVEEAVRQTVARFGRLDALINNAGVGGPWNVPVEQLRLEDWNRVLAVNLTGMFLLVKHAAPHLRAAAGAVVNIASTRALQSEANTLPYSASKGGVLALTHALAVSLGPEVRVNCISPGWIEVGDWQRPDRRRVPQHSLADRAQHPAGRVGTPADIAALAAYLISDAAGFVTGQNLVVDGGMTTKMIYV